MVGRRCLLVLIPYGGCIQVTRLGHKTNNNMKTTRRADQVATATAKMQPSNSWRGLPSPKCGCKQTQLFQHGHQPRHPCLRKWLRGTGLQFTSHGPFFVPKTAAVPFIGHRATRCHCAMLLGLLAIPVSESRRRLAHHPQVAKSKGWEISCANTSWIRSL